MLRHVLAIHFVGNSPQPWPAILIALLFGLMTYSTTFWAETEIPLYLHHALEICSL